MCRLLLTAYVDASSRVPKVAEAVPAVAAEVCGAVLRHSRLPHATVLGGPYRPFVAAAVAGAGVLLPATTSAGEYTEYPGCGSFDEEVYPMEADRVEVADSLCDDTAAAVML